MNIREISWKTSQISIFFQAHLLSIFNRVHTEVFISERPEDICLHLTKICQDKSLQCIEYLLLAEEKSTSVLRKVNQSVKSNCYY